MTAEGLNYNTHEKSLPGTPDVVFWQEQMAVFVHGCYWHRHHRCRLARLPTTNIGEWLDRFAVNVRRDQEVAQKLRVQGWWVYVAWECEIHAEVDRVTRDIKAALKERAQAGVPRDGLKSSSTLSTVAAGRRDHVQTT